MLKATLVTMRDRSVIVTVSETDTIGNLQVIIGESMKNSHIDFQSLNFVKAFNITKVSDKLLNLKEDYIVADYLSPDEEVLFEIDSANFWLRIKFQLYTKQTLAIEGFTQALIMKNETISVLRKQLQLLMIQVWSLMSQVDSNFYFMDEFQIISLYPPVKQTDLNDTILGSDSYSASLARGPPAGNFRI